MEYENDHTGIYDFDPSLHWHMENPAQINQPRYKYNNI